MFCEHLSLSNFRNYVRQEVDLPPGVTLFVGANAQGKTNLLEALYYLATTRSFRAAQDREMVNREIAGDEFQFTRLAGRVRRGRDAVQVEIVLRPSRLDGSGNGLQSGAASPYGPPAAGPGMKRIRVNGAAKRALDLLGQINVVAFAPGDIDLVCGPPALRRRYLDITLSQIDPAYVRTLALYQKVLLQRNSLLKAMRENRARSDQLGYWDTELIGAGSLLIQRRAETLATINRLAAEIHRSLTDMRERLDVRYLPKLPLDATSPGCEPPPLGAIRERFAQELRASLPRETAVGQTLVGPHRDDIAFHVDGQDMHAYGSRGQQRTIALSLKLAELRLMREATGEQPILLLDDVMSELDEARRSRILGSIEPGQQVLATGTDVEHFDAAFVVAATIMRVRGGTIRAESSGSTSTI